MSDPLLQFSLAAASGGLAASLLLIRVLRSRRDDARSADPGIPGLLRMGWRVSGMLLPLARRLPASFHLRAARALAPEHWAASLPAERWLALRAAYAAAAALGGGILASLLAAPVAVAMLAGAAVAHSAMSAWLRRRRMLRERQVARELPPYLDLLTVSIEAGSSLTAAMRAIVDTAPPGALRDYFERVLRQIRAGSLRADAFAGVAEQFDSPPLRTLATALAHGEASGMSLGTILRAQGAQRTAERFARAEKLAMEAPVKLLGPLILCIFPCTFIVLAVPIVVRLREALGP